MEIISRFRVSADDAARAQARLDALLTAPPPPAASGAPPRVPGWVPGNELFARLATPDHHPPPAGRPPIPPVLPPESPPAAEPVAPEPVVVSPPGPAAMSPAAAPVVSVSAEPAVVPPAVPVPAVAPEPVVVSPLGPAVVPPAVPVLVPMAVPVLDVPSAVISPPGPAAMSPAAAPPAGMAPVAGLAGAPWPEAAESGLAAPPAVEPVPLLAAAAAGQIEPRPVAAPSAGAGRSGRAGPDGAPVGGAWARWASRWLPEALVAARVNPGRRAAASLLLVALAGAGLAAGLAWRTRPAVVAVTAPALAGGPSTGAPPGGAAAASKAPEPVVVAVAGRVRHPGVVRLPAGARVLDAVRAAGGVLPRVDLGLLNLARRLADGELVVVGVPGAPEAGSPGGSPSPGAGPGPAAAGTVDLNAATAEQLDALPGVGPVLAQRIVEWRAAHGRFDSVAQLQEVGGIGAAKFAQLRDRVTV